MSVLPSTPQWFKTAVFYEVLVRSFSDSDGNGVGDFKGLTSKLDYLEWLGVDCLWVPPFYISPLRDGGYDVADYTAIMPECGTIDDFNLFIAGAHRRGIRVIADLVMNHTSDAHPWFQASREDPEGPYGDFYVWSDSDEGYPEARIIFPDTEPSNWTWDPVRQQYYWHRFFAHQPDLNYDNPAVHEAMLQVVDYWLGHGIDGFRLDAVPYLYEREGTDGVGLKETHAFLKKVRRFVDEKYPDAVLLCEANEWPTDVIEYFGDPEVGGDECHMAFHFPVMPRIFMAVRREQRMPISEIMAQTPAIPSGCQWGIFLRNHDELTLEMVTDDERDYMWAEYAKDPRMKANLGIRRRLAPLLERDRRRIELLNSFLLSMPGTPVLYYGDEIGMGDNIHLGDRDGVRTPMQWTSDRNGGFSRANPQALVLPPIMDPLYGYEAVNVEAQSADPYSLLNWMRRMLEVRSKHQAFGRGTLKLIYPNNRKILSYLREYADPNACEGCEFILCVANVSHASQAVEIDLSSFAGKVPVEMLGGVAFPPIGQLPYLLTLPPFGFYWFILASEQSMPSWYAPPAVPLPDYQTLVLPHGAPDLLRGAARMTLERDTLPQYLALRRWYAGKQKKLDFVRIALATSLPVPAGTAPMMLTELLTSSEDGSDRYFLPLGVFADDGKTSGLPQQLALARVRRDRRVGMLTDAFSLDAFATLILQLIQEQATIESADGQIHCSATLMLAETVVPQGSEIRRISTEQSNSSVVIGDLVVLKIIRHLTAGIHPELEMGRVLTERGYANAPALLGDVTRISADGVPHTLIVMQRFVHNQGDGWNWTLNTLSRTAHRPEEVQTEAPASEMADPMIDLLQFAAKLGLRLAELHAVLAQPSPDAAFAPERAGDADCEHWKQETREQLSAAYRVMEAGLELPEEVAAIVQQLLLQKKELCALIDRLAASAKGALRTRIHGDFHLGQVLVGSGDVYIVDFEGEPARTLEQRREKNSPWRDVAGLLRSYDYAAHFAASSGPADLGEAALARRQKILQRYLPESRDAFLEAYRNAAPDHVAADALLELFTLEKAAYEICYEAANRPSWLSVPLRGLAQVAERLLHPDSKQQKG